MEDSPEGDAMMARRWTVGSQSPFGGPDCRFGVQRVGSHCLSVDAWADDQELQADGQQRPGAR
jgi:hypothetical protein